MIRSGEGARLPLEDDHFRTLRTFNFETRHIMQPFRTQLHLHGWTIAMAFVLLLIAASFPATAQSSSEDSGEFMFDVLFVNRGPDKDHISAFTDSNYRNEVKVYEHYQPQKTIQWALDNARTTVITDGNYKVHHPITVKRSNSNLVIGPKATIRADTRFPLYSPVVEVNHADHVQVFNLGTLEGKKGVGVEFNGQSGDDAGITGGMLFGTGTVQKVRACYWLVDTENVKVPLTLSSNPVYAVAGMEGTRNTKVGTVAQLTNGVHNDGSTLDITMNNTGVNVQRVIGPSPDSKTPVVHLNNFRNVTVNQVTGVVGSDGTNHSLTDVTLYDVPGLMYQVEWDRPLFGTRTARPNIMENKGFEVKNVNRVRESVANFSKEVRYSGFPGSIPELNVEVHLKAEFEDGSSGDLFSKSYTFNLNK